MFTARLMSHRRLAVDEDEAARDLKPASAAELEESLSFVLRYAGRRRGRS